jgi:O-antigen/teichoic acid export membrane protein
MSSAMRSAIAHGVVIYLGTAVSSLIMLVVKVLIDRELGTDVLGEYELGLSLVLLISVFALFGFHTSIARGVAKEGEAAYPLVRKAYFWVLCVCGVATGISTPLINWIYGDTVVPYFALYLSPFLFAVCLLNLNMAFFQGRQRMSRVSGTMALDSVARGCAVALALILALQAHSLLLAMGLFALAFEILVTMRIHAGLRYPGPDAMPFGDFAHLSFYIFLIAASGAISVRMSAFVVAYSLSMEELGFFAIANVFTLPLSLLGRTIETVLLPRASSGSEFDLGRFAALAFALALGAIPLYYIFSGTAVGILFGEGNDQAVVVLRILSVGYSAILVYSVFSAYIFGRAPRRFLAKLVVITFAQSLLIVPALNSYLVGSMGLPGAGWATNIALIIQTSLWVGAGLLLSRRNGEPHARAGRPLI